VLIPPALLKALRTFYYVLECTLPGSGANRLTVPNDEEGGFFGFYLPIANKG